MIAQKDERFRLYPRLQTARLKLEPPPTQSEVAKRLRSAGLRSIDSGRLSRLENGYADAHWREVEILADTLQVDPFWLASKRKPRAPKTAAADVPASPTRISRAPAPAPAPPIDATPHPDAVTSKPIAPTPQIVAPPPASLAPVKSQYPVPETIPAGTKAVKAEILRIEQFLAAHINDKSFTPADYRAWRLRHKNLTALLPATS